MTVADTLVLGVPGPAPEPAGNFAWLVLGAAATVVLNPVGSDFHFPWGRAATAGECYDSFAWGSTGDRPECDVSLPWGSTGKLIDAITGTPFARATFNPYSTVAPWARAGSLPYGVSLPWQAAAKPWARVEAPWKASDRLITDLRAPWGRMQMTGSITKLPWGPGVLVIAPNEPYPVPPAPLPPVTSPRWANLHFCPPGQDDPTRLVLGVDPCYGYIAPVDGKLISARRTYMQSHVLSAVLLPGLEVIPFTRFSISTSRDSTGWNLSADGPLSILDQLAPDGALPAQVRVSIDGLDFEFLIDGRRRNRSFGKAPASITGRSSSYLLSDRYSPKLAYTNTEPMTAQQIVQAALEFTGVGLDWRVTDWLVPAEVWSFVGTPMDVVKRVADSIKAIVQSPRTGDNIIIAPRYPTLPWLWGAATPDVVIASYDPVTADSFEQRDQPDYDGIYVSGQAQGELALVKLAGSGPSLYMPMITDQLLTDLEACRQRGESELSTSSGIKLDMSLTLPVLTGVDEPGVIDVGKLVEVHDTSPLDEVWRGMVTGVSIESNFVKVRQTITLERVLT